MGRPQTPQRCQQLPVVGWLVDVVNVQIIDTQNSSGLRVLQRIRIKISLLSKRNGWHRMVRCGHVLRTACLRSSVQRVHWSMVECSFGGLASDPQLALRQRYWCRFNQIRLRVFESKELPHPTERAITSVFLWQSPDRASTSDSPIQMCPHFVGCTFFVERAIPCKTPMVRMRECITRLLHRIVPRRHRYGMPRGTFTLVWRHDVSAEAVHAAHRQNSSRTDHIFVGQRFPPT